MTSYYAPSTRAFYDSNIPAPIPADAIEISAEQHQVLVVGVNAGGTIVIVDGDPVLTPYAAPAPTASDLAAYANRKQWEMATGGFSIAIDGTPRTFATDSTAQGLITGKSVRLGQPNPPASIDWQFADVGFVMISAADFIVAATAIADFVQATFDALKPVLAAIGAGTITTIAEIDAAAWPANHQ